MIGTACGGLQHDAARSVMFGRASLCVKLSPGLQLPVSVCVLLIPALSSLYHSAHTLAMSSLLLCPALARHCSNHML